MSARLTTDARARAGSTAARAMSAAAGHVAGDLASGLVRSHASRCAAAAMDRGRVNGVPPHSAASPTKASSLVVDPATPALTSDRASASAALRAIPAPTMNPGIPSSSGPLGGGHGVRVAPLSSRTLSSVAALFATFAAFSLSSPPLLPGLEVSSARLIASQKSTQRCECIFGAFVGPDSRREPGLVPSVSSSTLAPPPPPLRRSRTDLPAANSSST